MLPEVTVNALMSRLPNVPYVLDWLDAVIVIGRAAIVSVTLPEALA